MVLVIDIGNTDIVLGFFQGKECVHLFRHSTGEYASLGERLSIELTSIALTSDQVSVAVLSSVVPGVTPAVIRQLTDEFEKKLLVLGPELFRKLPVKVHNPDEIGSDLVANSIAAFDILRAGCIVVDFGTALTVTTINDRGEIEGVAIAPGLQTAMKSLFMNTAQLPEVPLIWPESAIGKGTEHALQAGILRGYVGLVRELIRSIREEKGNPDLPAIATGGLSEVIPPLRSD
ncbi:MAG: type III pantothenate kinase, partial [Bacteroidia bacterium]|nr:type III pantothenate kinase [Bacteroidia bacterium]